MAGTDEIQPLRQSWLCILSVRFGVVLGQCIPHRVEQYKWKNERSNGSKWYADFREIERICRQVQDQPDNDRAYRKYNTEDCLRRNGGSGARLAMMHDRTNLSSEYSANDEWQFRDAHRNGPHYQKGYSRTNSKGQSCNQERNRFHRNYFCDQRICITSNSGAAPVSTFPMYPIWLIESAGELNGGECLAWSRLNTDAPACQTGASWGRGIALVIADVAKSLSYGQDDRQWSRYDERLFVSCRNQRIKGFLKSPGLTSLGSEGDPHPIS